MMRRVTLTIILIAAALGAAWGAWTIGRRWYAPRAAAPAATQPQPQPANPAAPERKIKATLYFVSEDGLSLVASEREIPFAEPIVLQARRIVEAQLGAPPPPLAAPIPAGTTLRTLFITERGDAFVDLSPQVTTNHPGGALNELFTVYAIVDALTVNLPAITRVQILVNGKEADTLAGHVDLRRPLQKSLKWLPAPAPPAAEAR
jgi:sporulation and spore germination protein